MRIVSAVAAFFEAGILFIVASFLFLVFMPIAAIVYFVVYISALLRRRKINLAMREKLTGKRVIVLFADRDTDFSDNSFFCGLCKNLAKTKSSAVIVVSPFFFSPSGIGGKSAYVTIRKESEDLYICRRVSFFSLRRTVLCELDTVYFF